MRGEHIKPKYRLISSPSNQQKSKWFTDLCLNNPTKVIHASALDNPFTSDEFKQSLKDRYGEGSILYRQQVLGEFVETDSSDSLLLPSDFVLNPISNDQEYYIGCDIARFGTDRTCIILRNSFSILKIITLNQADSNTIATEIRKLYADYKISGCFLDGTGGYSSGVYDMLKTNYNNVYEVNFGSKSQDAICTNMRAYMYRQLKNAVKNGFYVEDKDLKEELLCQKLKMNERGLFQMVSKDEIKEILGRSPDLADSLALSFANNNNSCYTIDKEKERNYINILFRS